MSAAIMPRSNNVSKGPALRSDIIKEVGMKSVKRMMVVTMLRRLPVLNRVHSLLISRRKS